jgi:hypothetical protein
MNRQLTAVFSAGLLLAAAAGCGSPEPPVPVPVATPTVPPSIPASVVLASLSDLRASVPELNGWTRGEIVAREEPAPNRSAHVGAAFTRGAQTLQLEIADTGGAPRAIESLEHVAGSTTNRTVGNGYFKGTTLKNLPAVESWNTMDKMGELSVLIKRRYIIHVAGSGLPDAAPMRALAEAVDISRLR